MSYLRSGLGKVVVIAGACSGLMLGTVQVASAAPADGSRSSLIPGGA